MIYSKDNQLFKKATKLKQKKYRDQMGLFLVYGPHLIAEAKKYNAIDTILTSDEKKEGVLFSSELINELSQTVTPFDSIAICKKVTNSFNTNRILALDDISDPANLGALIRSALAFGFTKIIGSLNTVDLYNEKVIRASQGAIFAIEYQRRNLPSALLEYKELGYQVYGADAHKSKHLPKRDEKLIIVLGNEGRGLSTQVKEVLDGMINIKTNQVESLNVSIAGSILMYEWKEE